MSTAFGPVSIPAEQRRATQRIDFGLIIATVCLITAGLMSLYSEGSDNGKFFHLQVRNLLIGLIPFSLFLTVHPRFWRRSVNWIYVVNLVLLLLVLKSGKSINGSMRWVKLGPIELQPSEVAKLLVVLTLSTFYVIRQDVIGKFSTFLLGFLHVIVPMVLVLKQPHLGATLTLLVAWVAISTVAGVPIRYIVPTLVIGATLVGVVVGVPAVRNRVFKPYQLERIEGMLGIINKNKDVKGINYQTDRAEIAFGVGGVSGAGFLNGEQKKGHYIPYQYNDFVITVVGEEGGLIGTSMVLAAFGYFFYRIFLIMLRATDPYYKMVAGGVFAVLGFHMFVNIAMVLQVVPVVGLWLPFISYGGTALWLCMACVGLMLNIRFRERPLLF